jgi:hypothetical protein
MSKRKRTNGRPTQGRGRIKHARPEKHLPYRQHNVEHYRRVEDKNINRGGHDVGNTDSNYRRDPIGHNYPSRNRDVQMNRRNDNNKSHMFEPVFDVNSYDEDFNFGNTENKKNTDKKKTPMNLRNKSWDDYTRQQKYKLLVSFIY